MSVNSKMTAIANAIRAKTGGNSPLTLDQMATEISGISGASELNFRVVGGTSEPSNPAVNTIWIHTSTPITSYVFSVTQPIGSDGMVWIQTGTTSGIEFNALNTNAIQVYPLVAKQYISGAWTDKSCKSYQDGVWISWWNGELYDSGNQYTAITGGWEYKKYVASGYGSDLVTLNDSNMVVESHSSQGSVFAGTKSFDPSRLANYTKFCVTFSLTRDDSSGWCRVGVASDYTIESTTDFIAAEKTESAGSYTKTLDISAVSSGYPLVAVFNGTMTITKIWLE